MDDLWYKNAVIYCVDVDTYMDSDGDGIGDFAGLTNQLSYIASLGVTCVWLLPFYPTPNRDNGYDVTDYYSVDPRLGNLGDFVIFMRRAREHGIRVIIDLVVNHTSDQHPWFQAACEHPQSKYHDYYVWSEEKPEDADKGVVFPGVQESTWTYDDAVGAYYFHRFYKHQPDLNISNPAVRGEILKVMGFWLELGVSGFRVDAAPFLIEMRGANHQSEDRYKYLREMHDFLSWRRGDAILLAEANVSPEIITKYFGDGDRMHMLFNFYVNQHTFLALAREQATPVIDALRKTPTIPPAGQWANFLRNHDELDLGRLSDDERQEVFAVYAPEKRMRLYDRGIRRRLAPMLHGDERLLKLAYSVMFALPGTPVLWYGEELGMGDDLSLKERNSVRTPMQWSEIEQGGFSTAPPEQLIRPVIAEGEYGYQHVNAAEARRNSDSLLNWIERLIRVRKEHLHIGRGDWRILETGNQHVLALYYDWGDSDLVILNNFAPEPCEVAIDLDDNATHIMDLLADRQYRRLENDLQKIELGAYGSRWLRVDTAKARLR